MSRERVEAQLVVPAGVQVSAAVGSSGAAAAAVTATAQSVFLTTLLADLQTQLNNNVQGYPQTALAMAAVVGGTWTSGAGYLLNEPSGNPASAFGVPGTLAANSLSYGSAGPRGGIDTAIGFTAGGGNANGSNVFNVTSTDDIVIAWVGYLSANPAATRALISKYASPTGWFINVFSTGEIRFGGDDTTPASSWLTAAGVVVPTGVWHVGIACVDRSTGKARIGVHTLAGVAALSAEATATATSCANAGADFGIGIRSDGGALACTEYKFAAAYITAGSSVATGLSANLSTALSNFAAAINASWSASLSSTTGRVSIGYTAPPAGAPSFSLDWTSTTLRDLLGFTRDIDYATTAAQIAADIGWGNFTTGAGYLLNEASGDPASAFGTPATLTATGSWTYGRPGPRGGADKAILPAAGNNFFDGGNSFDCTTGDLLGVYVGRWNSAPIDFGTILSKVSPSLADGWTLHGHSSGIRFHTRQNGGTERASSTGGFLTGEWHVGIFYVDRGANAFRVAIQGLVSGTQLIGNTATPGTDNFTTAAHFRVGASTWTNTAQPSFDLAAFSLVTGSGVAANVHANLSAALANFAATFGTWTGTKQAKGVWVPQRPINLDGDPKQAPKGDDGAATISPTGAVYGLSGSFYYRHRNVRFPKVAKNKVWSADATVANEDWETFYLDTQRGQHSWFTTFSPIRVYWDNAGAIAQLGNGIVSSWSMPKPKRLDELALSDKRWAGLVDVDLGDLYAVGS